MITVRRTSDAVDALHLTPRTNTVTVDFKNGTNVTYTGVPSDAISDVINNDTVSLGFWMNKYCVQPARQQYAA